MDQNNRKLKILHKCIKKNTSTIWQHLLHIPPTKLLISKPFNKTKQNKTRRSQKSLPFGKWRFIEKRSQENGPKAEEDETERAAGLGRRTKEEI